jgi:hypothetical protein
MPKTAFGGYEIKSLPAIRDVDGFLLAGELERCERERLLKNGSNGDQPQRFCECPEYLINGKRGPCPPQHSCAYTRLRSALVSEASRIATQRVGDPLHDTPLGCRWTFEFNKIMDRLAAPLLKQSDNGEHERKSA